MTTENINQLLQKGRLVTPVHFTLLHGRELEIINPASRNNQRYKVDLLALRAPSERIVNVAWRWWLASLGTLLLLVGLVWLLSYIQLDTSAVLVSGIGVLVTLMLAFLSWQKGSRQQVFYSRHSNVPLVTLRLGLPNKNEFKKFVSLLEKQIETIKAEFKLTRDQELAGEMRTLRRLRNDGIISLDDYDNSKEVLFQKH